ncbi:MAG: SPOR domain-containing protein [Balneolaceae bacterium]
MVLSNFIKAFFVTLFLLQSGFLNLYAQDGENYSRIGLTIQGGYTFAGNITGIRLYRSNFNRQTVSSYNQGMGLKFALMPFWSIETGYRYNTITGGASSEFETEVQSASLKNIFNFNRLYQKNSLSEVLNVYGIAGYEHDFYEYSSPFEQNKGHGSSIVGGLGVELSIGRAFDLFSQYEMKFSSNRIDNITSGSKFDQIGMASAGIRFNFGSDDARPLKHKPRVGRPLEADTPDFVNAPEEPQPLQSTDSSRSEEIQTSETLLTETEEKYRAQIDSLTDRLHVLQEKIDSLENDTEPPGAEPRRTDSGLAAEEVQSSPGAFYIQVFNSRRYSNAEEVKNRFEILLAGEPEAAEKNVFVTEKDSFYKVWIGDFPDLSATRNVLEIAHREIPDAFPLRIER